MNPRDPLSFLIFISSCFFFLPFYPFFIYGLWFLYSYSNNQLLSQIFTHPICCPDKQLLVLICCLDHSLAASFCCKDNLIVITFSFVFAHPHLLWNLSRIDHSICCMLWWSLTWYPNLAIKTRINHLFHDLNIEGHH